MPPFPKALAPKGLMMNPTPLTSPLLAPLDSKSSMRLRHGFFTRAGGVSSGIYDSLNVGLGSSDEAGLVEENRRRCLQSLALEATEDSPKPQLFTVYQSHGTEVVTLSPHDDPLIIRTRRADGIVTKGPGQFLGILTADCAPLLFADQEAAVIAACHAGWKGALGGIMEATLTAMLSQGARLHSIKIVIGPCIGKDSYQVGAEFRQIFLSDSLDNRVYFHDDPSLVDHYRFDLAEFAKNRLMRFGIDSQHIAITGYDTYADHWRFFSYRRTTHAKEADYGRQLSAIGWIN